MNRALSTRKAEGRGQKAEGLPSVFGTILLATGKEQGLSKVLNF